MEYEPWLGWAVELQAIAQAGLAYSKDKYDIERFSRIREIAAEIMSVKSGLPTDIVKDLFCSEAGYQTPKIDTRAAIIDKDKILLVREKSDGLWALPGGWMDVNESVSSNIIKETKEEAGLEVIAERLIAVQDRKKHNHPPYAYGICKIFVLCRRIGGEFLPNTETSESAFFSMDNLPPLSAQRITREQIEMCFSAYRDENWKVLFD